MAVTQSGENKGYCLIFEKRRGSNSQSWESTQDNGFGFEWAVEYHAVSVSESDLNRVRAYIDMQEDRHRKTTFGEEVDEDPSILICQVVRQAHLLDL